ncbi:MAG: hypothetical protein BWK73_37760 [Thiothrix lacustris]|uniref:Uncharacterized protein n=1 Tax=Thiothrix lacustris TaxID=525917 RepID=A0A1Y1QF47_9GAMM|nr:MAG: hypothetical protein BWK73_37760 [Thiothrix lacustris]
MQAQQVDTTTKRKRNRLSTEAREYRQLLADTFPHEGNVRAPEIAARFGMGLSTFWKYVAEGRIKQPTRYGSRISVWDAEYIRTLEKNGIPDSVVREGSV